MLSFLVFSCLKYSENKSVLLFHLLFKDLFCFVICFWGEKKNIFLLFFFFFCIYTKLCHVDVCVVPPGQKCAGSQTVANIQRRAYICAFIRSYFLVTTHSTAPQCRIVAKSQKCVEGKSVPFYLTLYAELLLSCCLSMLSHEANPMQTHITRHIEVK